MIKAISELKKAHVRIETVLNELEVLEDGVDVDYTECLFNMKYVMHELENRRETLQKRGRTQ